MAGVPGLVWLPGLPGLVRVLGLVRVPGGAWVAWVLGVVRVLGGAWVWWGENNEVGQSVDWPTPA